jgi:phosphoribosylglycinamide formyltransferase-1
MDGVSHPKKIGLAVLISGEGTNLQSIIDACRIDAFPSEIRLVISNKGDAHGLIRAQNYNIPTRVVSHKDYLSKADFEQTLLSILAEYDIDLICLAGFMRILSPFFVSHWAGRLINIHPSLLPKYQGLNTHERAVQSGDTESGCTVHYVTENVDDGGIILQRTVAITPSDTPQSLAAKVLEQEHIAYPAAIKIMASKLTAPE